MRASRWTSVVSLCAAGVLAFPAVGGASPDPASPDRAGTDAGPPLSVPAADLAQSLRCSADLDHAQREPVLLVPGTAETPAEFSWNYVPAFQQQHVPFCTVELPDHAMGDIQVNGEYVVHAIRAMSARSGHKVQIVGHSQGGMVPRWALKYWPDTRRDVDDLIGLAPSNHGTVDSAAVCATGCGPAFRQQGLLDSNFLRALNSGPETYPGISYTSVASRYDEVVVPNIGQHGSSFLHTGGGRISNVQIQSACPLNVSDHLTTGTSDPVGYAAVEDALAHPGPADPDRLPKSACATPFMPAVDPVTFPTDFAQVAGTAANQVLTHPREFREPPLKPYAAAPAR